MNKIAKNSQEAVNIVDISSLSHDGRGIATINHKKTFVTGALPEETISCTIIKKRSSYNEATLVDILKASANRITPACPHFGICGGCSLQHLDQQAQLALKQQTLLDQLKHFGKVIPETVLAPLQANSEGYRHKARLGVRFVYKKNKVLVGFREKASRYLAELDQCVVLHPKVGLRLLALAQLVASLSITEAIAQIEVAIGDEDVALVFRHLKDFTPSDHEKLIEFGMQHHFHIYLQPNPPAAVHRLLPKGGDERLSFSLPDHALTFQFHPLDFTQINLQLNRLMVNQALRLLDLNHNENVLDLFCGIGNFTLPIARYAGRVTGIEGSLEMVHRAEENMRLNNIANACFHAANLMTPPENAVWIKPYDKILLDPPRVGAKEILPTLARCDAKRIIYVSCNPATLARDAHELVYQYGYKLIAAGIMNMFPHTAHIEAMAVFQR